MLPDLLRARRPISCCGVRASTDPPPAAGDRRPSRTATRRASRSTARAPLRRAAGHPGSLGDGRGRVRPCSTASITTGSRSPTAIPRRQRAQADPLHRSDRLARSTGGCSRRACRRPTARTTAIRPRWSAFAGGRLVPADPGGERAGLGGRSRPGGAAGEQPAGHLRAADDLERACRRCRGGISLGVGTFRDVRGADRAGAEPVANFAGMPALERGRAHLSRARRQRARAAAAGRQLRRPRMGLRDQQLLRPDYDLGFPRRPRVADRLDRPRRARQDLPPQRHPLLRRRGDGLRHALVLRDRQLSRTSTSTAAPAIRRRTTAQDFGGALFKYGLPHRRLRPDLRQSAGARAGAADHAGPSCRAGCSTSASTACAWTASSTSPTGTSSRSSRIMAGRSGASAPRRAGALRPAPADAALPGRRRGARGAARSRPPESRRRLWNEDFKRMVRAAILGRNDDKEPSFEWTVRKLIDCRLLGFEDGAQAVNYVTSHDVEGFRNERLFDFLAEQRRRRQGAAHQARLRLPAHRGRHPDDPCRRGVRRPARPPHPPPRKAGRPGQLRPRRGGLAPRHLRLRRAPGAAAHHLRGARGQRHRFHPRRFRTGQARARLAARPGRSGEPVVVVANFSDFGTAEPFNGRRSTSSATGRRRRPAGLARGHAGARRAARNGPDASRSSPGRRRSMS